MKSSLVRADSGSVASSCWMMDRFGSSANRRSRWKSKRLWLVLDHLHKDCGAALFDRHQMGVHPLEVATRAAGFYTNRRRRYEEVTFRRPLPGGPHLRPRVG